MMIKDPEEVQRLASEMEDENMRFRTFLKGHPIDSEELDKLVTKLTEQVEREIDCQACMNCCKLLRHVFSDEEVSAIAKHLKVSEEKLRAEYLIYHKDPDPVNLDDDDDNAFVGCPMFDGNKCLVESIKPIDCQEFPFLKRKEFRSRLFSVVSNCEICPIAFNVYQLLKDELDWDNSVTWDDLTSVFRPEIYGPKWAEKARESYDKAMEAWNSSDPDEDLEELDDEWFDDEDD